MTGTGSGQSWWHSPGVGLALATGRAGTAGVTALGLLPALHMATKRVLAAGTHCTEPQKHPRVPICHCSPCPPCWQSRHRIRGTGTAPGTPRLHPGQNSHLREKSPSRSRCGGDVRRGREEGMVLEGIFSSLREYLMAISAVSTY